MLLKEWKTEIVLENYMTYLTKVRLFSNRSAYLYHPTLDARGIYKMEIHKLGDNYAEALISIAANNPEEDSPEYADAALDIAYSSFMKDATKENAYDTPKSYACRPLFQPHTPC